MNTGDKVVCVDDKFSDAQLMFLKQTPKKDSVYVIRSVLVGVNVDTLLMDCRRDLTQTLLLVGLVNIGPNNKEMGFLSTRFRKLDEIQESSCEKKKNMIPA